MERSFVEMSEESLDYFKENILQNYLDENINVRKTISNLINTFIRHGGMEMWPEILNFLIQKLETKEGVEMSFETLNIILEDSGSYLEEKFTKFLNVLYKKLICFLDDIVRKSIDEQNLNLIVIVLNSLFILLESCPSFMHDKTDEVFRTLIPLQNIQNVQTRYNLGRCFLTVIRSQKEILSSQNNFCENLFMFFLNNFSVDYYEMNFISSEYFLILVENEQQKAENLNSENISKLIQENLNK